MSDETFGEEDEGPAGDLFGFGHRPGRRIVRARRPPQSQSAHTPGSSDLSGAIQILRQVNGRSPSAGGDQPPSFQNGSVAGTANAGTRGLDEDDEEDDNSLEEDMPPLEEINVGRATSRTNRPAPITGRGQRERFGFPHIMPQLGGDYDDDDDSDGEDDIPPRKCPRLCVSLLHTALTPLLH